MSFDLQVIEKNKGETPDASIIWLHGLGASGDDFVPVIPELGLPSSLQVRFIFPHAPILPVTINGGMKMPAWYDIKAMDINRTVDVEQLQASSDAIARLVEQEIDRGVDSRRIVIAGFSQGGAVAYHLGLTYDKPLAGILALSTYFATADSISPSEANRELPIHVYHGTHDPMVQEHLGQSSVERLKAMGYQPTYTTYPMDHSVCLEEIQAIGAVLRELLA